MSTRARLCALDDLDPGSSRRFDVAGHRIAVVRIGDDLYAIGDRCTHQDVSLAEGDVDSDDRTLECWKHGSLFELDTGVPIVLPATKPVPVYTVASEGGDVFVDLP